MGKIIKGQHRHQFRPTPYPTPSNRYASEKIEWEQAICSVCLEAPHNAVLLLCSSHDKGCRPYMCGTGFRHSNCLDLFKKTYAKPTITTPPNSQGQLPSLSWPLSKKSEPTGLSCPLCRGEVKGWTVVEPARRYLNRKKRSCVQDGCLFTGTYRELKKHVKAKHRRAKPRKVDPALEAKWRDLEMQMAERDVMSTIRSTMPGAVVMGDYVIDMNGSDSDIDDFDDDDEDDFNDDSGEDMGFLRQRRNLAERYLFALINQTARLARLHRGNTVYEDGGNARRAVGYQSEEDDIQNGGNWNGGRPANLTRDGRRRQRRRQGRSRGGSEFGVS